MFFCIVTIHKLVCIVTIHKLVCIVTIQELVTSFFSFQGYSTDQEDILEEQVSRYSDFHTIDWLKDVARDRLRHRRIIRKRTGTVKDKISSIYDAASGWLIVFLIGVSVGVIAGSNRPSNYSCVSVIAGSNRPSNYSCVSVIAGSNRPSNYSFFLFYYEYIKFLFHEYQHLSQDWPIYRAGVVGS